MRKTLSFLAALGNLYLTYKLAIEGQWIAGITCIMAIYYAYKVTRASNTL